MDNEHFPHAGLTKDSNAKELYIRDIYFLNYHINHDKWDWFRFYELADAHRFEEDFDRYDPTDWIITTTEAGGGAATEALIDFINGVLLVTNDAADNDCDELTNPTDTFCLINSYPLYFEVRMKIGDALQSDFWAGIASGPSVFAGVQNGLYFWKPDGEVNVYFVYETATVAVAIDTGYDAADLTWGRAGFHWDGDGNVRWFLVGDSDPQVIATGVIPGGFAGGLPIGCGLFTPGFGIRNGEAVAKSLYVDYIKCDQKRVVEDAEDHIDENQRQQL